MPRLAIHLLAITLAVFATACGNKGPLRLPDKPVPAPAAPEQSAPVPEPAPAPTPNAPAEPAK